MKTGKITLLLILIGFSFGAFAQNVYTTKTGEKYHKSNCKYLKYSKKEITLKRAIALGYQACSVCNPPKTGKTSSRLNSSTHQTSLKAKEKPKNTTASQCLGKTKSGSRCKRKTKNANGKCYQHQ